MNTLAFPAVNTLDTVVSTIHTLQRNVAKDFWMLGRELNKIHEEHLWKLRVVNGKARWRSFDEFVRAEVQMSPAHAFNAIAIATHYSANDVTMLGQTHAISILKAPPDDRPVLIDLVKAGATVRETREAVRLARKKSGYVAENINTRTHKATKARVKKRIAEARYSPRTALEEIATYAETFTGDVKTLAAFVSKRARAALQRAS